MTKQCKDCNNTFTIEDGEINFYKSKNLHLPNRCKSCRDKRKSNTIPNNANSPNATNGYPSNNANVPNAPNGYPSGNANVSNAPNGYPSNNANVPNAPNGYPSGNANVPNAPNNYPSGNANVSNAPNGYPSNNGNFPNSPNDYSNSNVNFPDPLNNYSNSNVNFLDPLNNYSNSNVNFLDPLNNYSNSNANFPNPPNNNYTNNVNQSNTTSNRPTSTDKSYKNTSTNSRNTNRHSESKSRHNLLLLIAIAVFTVCGVFFNGLLSPSQTISSSSQTSPIDETNLTNLLEFRYEDYLIEHFNKHGSTLGHSTATSYLSGANDVINSSEVLKRIQSDGDTAYFLEATEEFVVVSTDNYIRTYFKPNDGIDYFNRQ